jgi:hypothetical protein
LLDGALCGCDACRSPGIAEPACALGGAQGFAQARPGLLACSAPRSEPNVPRSVARKAAARKTVFAASKSALRSARASIALY